MYLDERLSTKKIAIQLTPAGIPSPAAAKGKKVKSTKWNHVTISKMLKNPAFVGEGTYNKEKPEVEWIKFPFPPIITTERFQQIQARMEIQQLKPKRVYKGYDDHFLFDGLIYCGECGARMRKKVKTEKNGKVRLYYSCYWRGASADDKEMAGHKATCILTAVNADEIDNQLFNQIVEFLVEPKSLIDSWFRDINFEQLKERVDLLEQKNKLLQNKLADGFEYITGVSNPKMKRNYQEAQKKVEAEWQKMQMDLTNARNELANATNKTQRYESFKTAINKPVEGFRKELKTKGRLRAFLTALPFPEKKRLSESIIAPEMGGKCFVQYIRPADYLSNEELENVAKCKQNAPQTDREPYAHGDFLIDFDRIEAVINGLNRDELLGNVDSGAIPRRKKYDYRRRWFFGGLL